MSKTVTRLCVDFAARETGPRANQRIATTAPEGREAELGARSSLPLAPGKQLALRLGRLLDVLGLELDVGDSRL